MIKGWMARALILACAVGMGQTAAGAQRYRLEPLSIVSEQLDVFATGINKHNQVVGYIIDPHGDSHAVRWDEGVTLLPSLSAEGGSSEAYRINDGGWIVGKGLTADGFMHATLWRGDQVTDLGTLSGQGASFAQDVSESGVVVGSSDAAVGQSAFRWTEATGLEDYGNTDPPFRLAVGGFNGVNNQGLMVGTLYVFGSPYHAAYARAGDTGLTDLSPPGRESLGMALAVNDAGTMVGYHSSEASGNPQAAIFHDDGSMDFLGALGLEESWAQDVNGPGVIVGRAFSFAPGGDLIPKAFVYRDGQMHDLLELAVNGDDWLLIEAAGINDGGWIVGRGVFQGQVRGYVAIPVPEPCRHAAALVMCCAIGAARRVRGARRCG
jgi:probable HAF family extracellular repeat protein